MADSDNDSIRMRVYEVPSVSTAVAVKGVSVITEEAKVLAGQRAVITLSAENNSYYFAIAGGKTYLMATEKEPKGELKALAYNLSDYGSAVIQIFDKVPPRPSGESEAFGFVNASVPNPEKFINRLSQNAMEVRGAKFQSEIEFDPSKSILENTQLLENAKLTIPSKDTQVKLMVELAATLPKGPAAARDIHGAKAVDLGVPEIK